MNRRTRTRTLPALSIGVAGLLMLTACGSDDDAGTGDTADQATADETTDDVTTTDEETTDAEATTSDDESTVTDDEETSATADGSVAGGGDPGAGGPGGGGGNPGGVDPSSVTTEDALVEMIGGSTACGDGSLDLHRGHMPVESLLVEVLGISHDEMHVRMEQQGQNLAAVADDLGVGADTLEQSLVEYLSPAIDNLLDAGTITEDQATDYQALLEEAIEFRVNWDGEEAPLEFCTAAT